MCKKISPQPDYSGDGAAKAHCWKKKTVRGGKKMGRKTWKYYQWIGERLSFSSCKPHVNTVHIPKSTHTQTHTHSHTRTHTNKHFLHLSGVGSTQSTAEPGSLLLVSSICETAEVKHHPLCGFVKTCAHFVQANHYVVKYYSLSGSITGCAAWLHVMAINPQCKYCLSVSGVFDYCQQNSVSLMENVVRAAA